MKDFSACYMLLYHLVRFEAMSKNPQSSPKQLFST